MIVTGVQKCALPLLRQVTVNVKSPGGAGVAGVGITTSGASAPGISLAPGFTQAANVTNFTQIGRASCREREEILVVGGAERKKTKTVGLNSTAGTEH